MLTSGETAIPKLPRDDAEMDEDTLDPNDRKPGIQACGHHVVKFVQLIAYHVVRIGARRARPA